MAVQLNDIEDITCSYGILGRIFGFGNLVIESAGTYGKMIFDRMPNQKRLDKICQFIFFEPCSVPNSRLGDEREI